MPFGGRLVIDRRPLRKGKTVFGSRINFDAVIDPGRIHDPRHSVKQFLRHPRVLRREGEVQLGLDGVGPEDAGNRARR